MTSSPSRRAGLLLSAFALLLVAAFTLMPGDARGETLPVWCVFCSERAAADAILNILLFAPLGVGLHLIFGSTLRAAAAAAAVSVVIECIQFLLPGRDAALGDVIANGLGGLLGAVAAARWRSYLLPSFAGARRLRRVWAALAFAVLGAASWLLLPSLPESTWHGQWTPRLGHLGVYRGEVLSAELDGLQLPAARLHDSSDVRNSLLQGDTLRVRALAGPAPDQLAPIFSIYDEQEREIYLVGARGDDFIVRYRNRGAALRLDASELRVRGAFAITEPGDTLRLMTAWQERQIALGVNAHSTTDGLHTGDGWMLLAYSQDFPPRLAQIVTLLWVAFWFLPLGFWSGGQLRNLLEALLVWCGMLAIPLVFPVRFLPWPLALAAAVAAACGLIAARIYRRLAGRQRERYSGPISDAIQRSILA